VSHPLGEAFFQELLWVHGMIRQDLETVRELAQRVADGLPAEELGSELRSLKANGPLWALKVNCLHYCRFVHSHHRAEDVLLFPTLRAPDASIGPVVDRLEADHRRVSDLLDAVEASAVRLTAEADDAREAVVLALEELHGHLLDHLDYEERHGGPVIRRLDRIPGL
jgi:hypothetical protein